MSLVCRVLGVPLPNSSVSEKGYKCCWRNPTTMDSAPAAAVYNTRVAQEPEILRNSSVVPCLSARSAGAMRREGLKSGFMRMRLAHLAFIKK